MNFTAVSYVSSWRRNPWKLLTHFDAQTADEMLRENAHGTNYEEEGEEEKEKEKKCLTCDKYM